MLDFFQRGLTQLNPPRLVDEYRRNWTPDSFVHELNRLPPRRRVSAWLRLFEDLSLGRESKLGRRAGQVNLGADDAEAQVRLLGRAAVPGLVAILERHVEARPFNRKGSTEWKRVGAFTAEASLASSCAFLIARIGKLGERDIGRLQEVIRRRIALDRSLRISPTLAENVARVLHELRPSRFPESRLHPRTNKLLNSHDFV